MKEIAIQLQKVVFLKKVRIMKLSWDEHVQRGHTPFRRDCQVCQEAAARGRRHVAVEHPRAGVLSFNVAGPLVTGHDLEIDTKFALIGTYTWLLPPDEKEDREVPEKTRRRSRGLQRSWVRIEDLVMMVLATMGLREGSCRLKEMRRAKRGWTRRWR